jgi:hypothetical protein
VSRPDLAPPPIDVLAARGAAPGYTFLAPFDISPVPGAVSPQAGPLIVDDAGEPAWFLPLAGRTAMNARAQTYRGRPVLTWYEGAVLEGYGGDFVIFDPTYHEVARVSAGWGRHGDLHEFLLTPKGTALISIYQRLPDSPLVEGIVQEVDVATGRVVFEWRSSEHVGVEESFLTAPQKDGTIDYFHLNSVDVDTDGHLLVSSRHTCAVYKVHRRTGQVLWRLGGKRSDFSVAPDAAFAYQHDVRRQPDGTLTLFDNRVGAPGAAGSSRGVRLAVDMERRTVGLVQEYRAPGERAGWAMGNVQQLDDGGVFVGWGTDGSFSEFAPDGRLRYDARFGDVSVSYRTYRLPWVAHPTGEPAAAVGTTPAGADALHVSWNGATQVRTWQVHGGRSATALKPLAHRPRTGFETTIPLPSAPQWISVVGLDAHGRRVGGSAPFAV